MKQKVYIDVIITKHIEVEVPDLHGNEDAEIIEKEVERELKKLTQSMGRDWYISEANWGDITEV